MDKKILIIGAIGAALLFMNKNTTPKCKKEFLVGTNPICETELEKLGYFYWPTGKYGTGYYSLSDVGNPFNVPQAQFDTLLGNGLKWIKNPDVNSTEYKAANTFFNSFMKSGALPLIEIPKV